MQPVKGQKLQIGSNTKQEGKKNIINYWENLAKFRKTRGTYRERRNDWKDTRRPSATVQ